MALIGLSINISELQAIEPGRSALFTLAMHKMKFELIGRGFFGKRFGMLQEPHLPSMQAI